MTSLNIKLHLKQHCIETEVKKNLKNSTDLYFDANVNPDIILKKIELLQAFIEQSDFSKLRASDERLSGTKEAFVCIYRDNEKNIRYPAIISSRIKTTYFVKNPHYAAALISLTR